MTQAAVGYAQRDEGREYEVRHRQLALARQRTSQFLWQWFWIAFFLRLTLMLTMHLTEADIRFNLTKDAFLYDETASAMADYWRSNGHTAWPERVDTVYWDCSYEWAMGILYYFFGDSLLLGKFLSVITGALTPLIFWRIAHLMYGDVTAANRAAIWMAIFPSHLYYSSHMVRDAPATLALSLVFLGLISLSRPTSSWIKLALPVGLFLTAGFRFYMFFVLLLMIPAAIGISWILSPGNRLNYAIRVMFMAGIVLGVGIALNLDTLLEELSARQYLDLDFLNHIRAKMNRGSGAMFRGSDVPELGTDAADTSTTLLVGLYYFFVSVDPTNMGSIRQWMAVPEVLVVLFMAPSLWRGIKFSVLHRLSSTIHILIVTAGITFAYSAVATNAGPLMRWRLQVVGIYVVLAAVGWTLKHSRRRRQYPEHGNISHPHKAAPAR